MECAIPDALAGQPFELAVYDIVGRRVRLLERGVARPGTHRVEWDLRLSGGGTASRGSYFIRLRIRDSNVTRSVIVR